MADPPQTQISNEQQHSSALRVFGAPLPQASLCDEDQSVAEHRDARSDRMYLLAMNGLCACVYQVFRLASQVPEVHYNRDASEDEALITSADLISDYTIDSLRN